MISFPRLLVVSSAFILACSGVRENIVSSLDETYECGRNLTLTCMFEKDSVVVEWKYADNIVPIAQCVQNVCSVNPHKVTQYGISVDMQQGISNLTIIRATEKDNGKTIFCSDGSESASEKIKVRGSDVVIQKTGSLSNDTLSECGQSLTLTCMFKKNTTAIVWKYSNKLPEIAKCIKNQCSLNPKYFGQFNISFEKTQCFFNLTMIKLARKDHGKKLVCSDGSYTDSYSIRIRGYQPLILEDKENGTLQAVSGCVSQNTTVHFKWILISPKSKIEKEINPKSNNVITKECSNEHECGQYHQYQHIQTVHGKSIENGQYLKIIAIYGNGRNESHESAVKFIIEEEDDEKTSFTIMPILIAGISVLTVVITACMIVAKKLIVSRRNKPESDEVPDEERTTNISSRNRADSAYISDLDSEVSTPMMQ